MKKEFWFEEMRLATRRLKRGVTIGQLLEEKRSINTYLENILRIMVNDAGASVDSISPPRYKFFRRLKLWLKSFKMIF